MYGSNLQRSLRLLRYLSLHPADLPRYLSTCIRTNITPLEIELPWISYAAIDYLKQFIRPEHIVAELGGGGSTIFFARRACRVLCVESNDLWASRISQRLAELNLNNVQILTYPYDPKDRAAFLKSDYLNAIKSDIYNSILIDAYDEFSLLRPDCFYMAENHIHSGGCIVVDDSWRYPELHSNHHAKNWKEFRSIGPCRLGVTTTDIYFY